MRKIIACILAVFSVFAVFGHNMSDSVKVYFNINQWQFTPALGENAAVMDSFIERIRKAADDHNLDYIVIHSYTSPDGLFILNKRLSEERCSTMASLIIDRAGISPELIRSKPEGIAWSGLRRLVENTPDVPSRSKVLDILDNTPVWIFNSKGHVIDGRQNRLMSLDRGVPYRWMLEHFFPELRCAIAVPVYLRQDSCASAVTATATVNTADTVTANAAATPPHTVGRADTIHAVTPDIPEHAAADNLSGTGVASQSKNAQGAAANPDTLRHSADASSGTGLARQSGTKANGGANDTTNPRHRFALKTNLPYYAIMMPNLELEWLFHDRWSVSVEGNVAWWGRYSRNKSYRIAVIDPEVRHYVISRKPWHGMYVGVFAGGGWYDLQNGGTGYYGEGLMTGLSLGYMWPIGRNLSLEAGVGAGYVYTRFKEYFPYEGHHLYQRTKELNYFGPLKLKFSIAWRFSDRNKSKQTISER